MLTITRDPDSGVVDQDCVDLDPEKVTAELVFSLKHNRSFLGKSPDYWSEIILGHAQALADEADPDEYEMWEIRYLEVR